MIIPFGKYAGREVDELPTGYLEWLVGQAGMPAALLLEAQAVLARRKEPERGVTTALPMAEWMNRLAALLMLAPEKVFAEEEWWLKMKDRTVGFKVWVKGMGAVGMERVEGETTPPPRRRSLRQSDSSN